MLAKQHPNLLIIMSDEHAPMYSGPYRHPLVQTPHMDRPAEEGVPLLYDIAEDRDEFRNLANDRAYQAICQELETQLLAKWDPVEIEKQVRASQKARILVDQVTSGQWRKPPNSPSTNL